MRKYIVLAGVVVSFLFVFGIQAGAVQEDAAQADTEETNLLLNGDFEEIAPNTNLPRDWTFAKETTSVVNNAFSGKYAVKASGYYTCQITEIPDVSGKKYKLSGYFMNEDPETEMVVGLGIMWLAAEGKEDNRIFRKNIAKKTASSGWVEASYTTGELPNDAVKIIRFQIYISGKNTKGERAAIIVDNLKLVEVK